MDEDILLTDVRLSSSIGMTEDDVIDAEEIWRDKLFDMLCQAGVIDELHVQDKREALVLAMGGKRKAATLTPTLPTYFNPVVAFRDAKHVAGGTVGLIGMGFKALDSAICEPPCVEEADSRSSTLSELNADGSLKEVVAGHSATHVRNEVVYVVLAILAMHNNCPPSVMSMVPVRQRAVWEAVLSVWSKKLQSSRAAEDDVINDDVIDVIVDH